MKNTKMSENHIKFNTENDKDLYKRFNSNDNVSKMAEKLIKIGLVKNLKSANYILIFVAIIAILLTVFISKYFIFK